MVNMQTPRSLTHHHSCSLATVAYGAAYLLCRRLLHWSYPWKHRFCPWAMCLSHSLWLIASCNIIAYCIFYGYLKAARAAACVQFPFDCNTFPLSCSVQVVTERSWRPLPAQLTSDGARKVQSALNTKGNQWHCEGAVLAAAGGSQRLYYPVWLLTLGVEAALM